MDSDVKNFESLYRVELMTRAAKDVVAEFAGGGYYLPDLQREFSYSVRQMSQVILSMLRGLSIDAVSLVCQNVDRTRYSICDGGHRITTLQRFFAGKFSLDYPRSEDPDALSIKGCRFTDLSAFDQQRLAMMPLQCVMVYPRAFDKLALRAAELAVFRAKNSCAVRISSATMRGMSLAASCDELAFAREWFKCALKDVACKMGMSKMAEALLCNRSAASAALLVAACILTVRGLPAALTEVTRDRVVAVTHHSLEDDAVSASLLNGRAPNFSAVTREFSLAFLHETVPAIQRRSMPELRALYASAKQGHLGALERLRFVVETVCGKQDWSLLSCRGLNARGCEKRK